MKVIVKNVFQDKYDSSRSYAPGNVLDWDDPERIEDCCSRGLIEICGEDPGDGFPEEARHLAREGLEDMKVEDLKKLAADMGIDTAQLKKKAELIAAICAEEVIPGPEAYEE
jgi:hypothetical protein